MHIRNATADDLPAILEIHNTAIATSTAIWTDDLTDLTERERWFADHAERDNPVLVAETDGAVIGYAALGPWRAKTGFRHTVEDSVYVREGAQGAGVGHHLLTALLDLARSRGYHVMIADIEAGNAASIRLHERHGFQHCGTVPEVGTKFGRWLDLTVMRLQLQASDHETEIK
jgi:L-amino acid N-acyltransferase YncA